MSHRSVWIQVDATNSGLLTVSMFGRVVVTPRAWLLQSISLSGFDHGALSCFSRLVGQVHLNSCLVNIVDVEFYSKCVTFRSHGRVEHFFSHDFSCSLTGVVLCGAIKFLLIRDDEVCRIETRSSHSRTKYYSIK